jgi:hypothetical protein
MRFQSESNRYECAVVPAATYHTQATLDRIRDEYAAWNVNGCILLLKIVFDSTQVL